MVIERFGPQKFPEKEGPTALAKAMETAAGTPMTEIREQIIRIHRGPPSRDDCTNPLHKPTHNRGYSCVECFADAILAIPEIEEGQKLREKVKSGKLVELDSDRSFPDCQFIKPDNYMENAEKMKANCPCIRTGFRRVKVKG
ncbi:hypothetical protein LCGC14_1982310 [marine sediment metagenome]|uniref:Uncharacterized protein n=1 Tax=marine sediment metagenome TaxID=412755 RepID=A0A0F9HLS4_9ZZZZ